MRPGTRSWATRLAARLTLGAGLVVLGACASSPGGSPSPRPLVVTNDSTALIEVQVMDNPSAVHLVEPGGTLSTTFTPGPDPSGPAVTVVVLADGSSVLHRADLFNAPYQLRVWGVAGDLRLSRPPTAGDDRRLEQAIGDRNAPPLRSPDSGLPR